MRACSAWILQEAALLLSAISDHQFGDFDRRRLGAKAIAISAGLRRSGACVDGAVVPPPGVLCGAGWLRLLAQVSRRVFAMVRASSPTGCSVGLPFKSKRMGYSRTARQ